MTFINPGKFQFFLQVSKNVFIRPKPVTKITLNGKLRGLLYIYISVTVKTSAFVKRTSLGGVVPKLSTSFRLRETFDARFLHIFKRRFAKFCFPVDLRFQRFRGFSKSIR